eukprot:scaffold2319_cov406-Prasinococcus_capsulatus_cf.AAC.6
MVSAACTARGAVARLLMHLETDRRPTAAHAHAHAQTSQPRARARRPVRYLDMSRYAPPPTPLGARCEAHRQRRHLHLATPFG